jgi:hypothetical protein
MKAWQKAIHGTAVALLFVALQTSGASANLVTNGGFETGNFSGWTTTNASSGSDYFVSNLTSWAIEGTCVAAFGATGNYDDTISQTISTTAGKWYAFSFWVKHDAYNNLPNDFKAYWNGNPVLNLVNTDTFDWHLYSFNEVANGPTTVSFAGRENGVWYYLDAVSVTAAPVPLPPAIFLFAPGLVGLAAVRRRFKK